MSDQWHYVVDGKQQGPVDLQSLIDLAKAGGLSPQDLVWKEGMGAWEPAGSVPGLFPQPAAAVSFAPMQPGPAVADPTFPQASGLNYYNPAPPGAVVAYAGFWLRFVAYILDNILLRVVQYIGDSLFSAITGTPGFHIGRSSWGMLSLTSGVGLTFFLLNWLYYALMESSANRRTLGKMAVGIMVTDLNGNTISFGKATGRYFGKMLSGLIIGIGYIMAGFTERKQALHDMMANCLVVRKELPQQR